MSNWNSPSNWSWKKAFEEHEKYVHQSDTTQQIINHLAGYPGESHGEFVKLSKDKQDELYHILGQIL